MENRSFTVNLKFEYDEKGIHTMEVLEINGGKGGGPSHVQSTKDTHVGTICTTIILTKKTGKEADPCAWVWNPLLRRWFWRCWDSGDTQIP